jgi:hypothetical protein
MSSREELSLSAKKIKRACATFQKICAKESDGDNGRSFQMGGAAMGLCPSLAVYPIRYESVQVHSERRYGL